eukprot:485223-Pelagomonas_calceolata.AAC.3
MHGTTLFVQQHTPAHTGGRAVRAVAAHPSGRSLFVQPHTPVCECVVRAVAAHPTGRSLPAQQYAPAGGLVVHTVAAHPQPPQLLQCLVLCLAKALVNAHEATRQPPQPSFILLLSDLPLRTCKHAFARAHAHTRLYICLSLSLHAVYTTHACLFKLVQASIHTSGIHDEISP